MSPSAKAERLRSRLSINPDEAPPAPARRAQPSTPQPATTELATTEPARTEPEPRPVPEPAPAEPAAADRLAKRPSRPSRPGRAVAAPVSAVDDPGITPGRKDYRSFYIEDAAFARFRAAIYWLSRREDATDEVPENMSVAVETWMEETAAELERRFNNGEVFRMPPPLKRRRRPTP